jgi:hypothetical protein
MRQSAEFYGQRELNLLYMARRLREALKLEDLLTRSAVDYCVETGEYIGGFLFRRPLTGAFFYVAPEDLGSSRQLLIDNHFKPYDPAREQ